MKNPVSMHIYLHTLVTGIDFVIISQPTCCIYIHTNNHICQQGPMTYLHIFMDSYPYVVLSSIVIPTYSDKFLAYVSINSINLHRVTFKRTDSLYRQKSIFLFKFFMRTSASVPEKFGIHMYIYVNMYHIYHYLF